MRRAGFLAVCLLSRALLAQTAITPVFSVQPDLLPAAQVSEVWLTVRTSTSGQLAPAGASAADAFTFTFDAVNNVGGPLITSADEQVTLHVSNKTPLVPGDFSVSAVPGDNKVTITYVKQTPTSFAAGDSFSLHVGLSPKIDTPFSCGVTFTETLHGTLPAGGQTLAFVDFAVGTKGPQGPAGPQGPQGATGPAGATGAAGQSVVGSSEPAGANCAAGGAKYVSASGTNFVCNGLQGATGATGSTGAQGPAGATGAAGAQGPAGAQGATGAQGLAGSIGPQGPAGPKGDTGATGPAGADGKSGGCSTAPNALQPALVPLLAVLAFAFRRRRLSAR